MLLQNAIIHDGLGGVIHGGLRVDDGLVTEVSASLHGEGEDLHEAHVFPGFVDAFSVWGINGSMTEIRPSSEDNDEKSDPVTPELDVLYAFNGRACSLQQLPSFGITSACVSPTDNNVFGGQMAVFSTNGVNPFHMCLRRGVGMKASLSHEIKDAYGKRGLAPMTRMKIFQQFTSWLKQAKEYDPSKEGTSRNEKLAALQKVISGQMKLFITCDHAADRQLAMEILREYPQVETVFVNAYGLAESDMELAGRVALIDGYCGMDCDPRGLNKDYRILLAMANAGVPVALSSTSGAMFGRECLLWEAMEIAKSEPDLEKVLGMMTSVPARILGIDNLTGSLQPGKRADLVIWSENPLTSYRAKVLKTLIAGETVWTEGDAKKCYI